MSVINVYVCVVFLLCLSSSCVPYVASFSGLSILYYLNRARTNKLIMIRTFTLGTWFFYFDIWGVRHSQIVLETCLTRPHIVMKCLLSMSMYVLCFCFVCLRLVYPMLPVSLECLFCIISSVFSIWGVRHSQIVLETCLTRPHIVSNVFRSWPYYTGRRLSQYPIGSDTEQNCIVTQNAWFAKW
jgi:hypothetical protein